MYVYCVKGGDTYDGRFNAAFAIQVVHPEKTIEECIALAKESLESGRALTTLKKFIELNNK